MRKFIYWKSAIIECEVSIVKPKPMDCKGDEELYLIEAPEQLKGERWYSHFFSDSIEYEQGKVIASTVVELNRLRTKKGIYFTQKDIDERVNSIKIERL